MPGKKGNQGTYSNPPIDINQRPFIPQSDKKYNLMMDLMCKLIKEDKSSEFRFCVDHLFVCNTRAASNLHKSCLKVYSANHLKGT